MKWSATFRKKVSLTFCEVSCLIESSQSSLPWDLRSFKLIPCHIFPTSQVLVGYPYIRLYFNIHHFFKNYICFFRVCSKSAYCHVDTVGQLDLLLVPRLLESARHLRGGRGLRFECWLETFFCCMDVWPVRYVLQKCKYPWSWFKITPVCNNSQIQMCNNLIEIPK